MLPKKQNGAFLVTNCEKQYSSLHNGTSLLQLPQQSQTEQRTRRKFSLKKKKKRPLKTKINVTKVTHYNLQTNSQEVPLAQGQNLSTLGHYSKDYDYLSSVKQSFEATPLKGQGGWTQLCGAQAHGKRRRSKLALKKRERDREATNTRYMYSERHSQRTICPQSKWPHGPRKFLRKRAHTTNDPHKHNPNKQRHIPNLHSKWLKRMRTGSTFWLHG